MEKPDFGLFDCDTHCYETRDAFTRYLPTEFLDRAITPVVDAAGHEVILAGKQVATFNSEQGSGFDLANRPGSLKEMLRQMASGDPEETYKPEPMRPEYVEREPRLALMKRSGRRQGNHLPGRNGAGGRALRERHRRAVREPPLVQPLVPTRLGASTMTTGCTPRRCSRCVTATRLEEVDRVLAMGARVVLLPTGPAYGHSPGDPYFDPIWSRLNEAGVTVAFHIMPYWYFDGHLARLGATTPTQRRGTCRPGSGTTSTASDRSRTPCPRSSSTTSLVGTRI